MATLSTPLQKQEVTRFTRFLTVGAVGTFLDFSILTLLKLAGMPTLFANSLSFTAGLLNNFTWNRLWTFSDTAKTDWHKQLAQFTLVSLVGLALNNLIILSLEGVFRHDARSITVGIFARKGYRHRRSGVLELFCKPHLDI